MQQMVQKILETYGMPVTLEKNGNPRTVKVFFQPVRSKSWQYLEGNYSPLGEIPRGQYVYIGPTEPRAEAGDTLIVGLDSYWMRRSELIWDANGPVYCWGICVEKGGEDTWGQS